MKLKKGDIAYTKQYGIGLFEVYKTEGNKIFTERHGWCNKGNGERLAVKEDFPSTYHPLWDKFLLQNKNQENNYEIY